MNATSNSKKRPPEVPPGDGITASSSKNNSPPTTDFQPDLTKGDSSEYLGCSIKTVPARLLRQAADTAKHLNPVNGPALERLTLLKATGVANLQFLTVAVSKYWGPIPRQLTVSFLEPTPAALRARILAHMNAWTQTTCISFAETPGTGTVRISRAGSGYWSYLGTDVLLVPKDKPTMNLQGFSMSTPEAEFRRVVRHETGHTLGFPHEHMRQELVSRIDPPKAYAYFLRTQGWGKATVDAQVLTALSSHSILGTPADQTSIMCYQLPATITKDGLPIAGGTDINATDYSFAGKIYPKPLVGRQPLPAEPFTLTEATPDWDEADDVSAEELEVLLQGLNLHPGGAPR